MKGSHLQLVTELRIGSTILSFTRAGYGYGRCLTDANAFGGFVATNSMFFSSGAPKFEGGFLNYTVGGMHYLSNGQKAIGNYEMHILKSVAACIYGSKEVSPYASLTVVNEQGQEELATTVVNSKGDWISLRATNFTFSQKTLRVRLNEKQSDVVATSPTVTAKKVGSSRGQVLISQPVGAGKIEIVVNNRRIAVFQINSQSDKRLTNGRISHRFNLTRRGNNEVTVKIAGAIAFKTDLRR